jgi:hypothetical protein
MVLLVSFFHIMHNIEPALSDLALPKIEKNLKHGINQKTLKQTERNTEEANTQGEGANFKKKIIKNNH